MASKGDMKEVKKSATNVIPSDKRKAALPSANNVVRDVSPTKKMIGQLRKRTSRMHAPESQEASVNEEEDNSIMPSAMASSTAVASPQDAVADSIHPPPFHFTAVTVKVSSDVFGFGAAPNTLRLTTNMLVGTIKPELMSYFISGDLIASVNGTPVWHRDHVHRVIIKMKQTMRAEDIKKPIDVVVIRPFNMEPPTPQQFTFQPDERFMYFVVTMGQRNMRGFATRFDKKRLVVSKIKATTGPSYALLIGDQILAIDDFVVPNKGSRKQCLAQVRIMWNAIKSHPTVKIFACRPISARSTPCPSVDGELVKVFPESIKGMDKLEKADDAFNFPIEGDSLEIAFRELVCLQQCIKPELPLPYTAKGKSLIRQPPKPPTAGGLTSSASGTNVSVSQDRSMYMPANASAASTMSSVSSNVPMAGTPRKMRWTGNQKQNKKLPSIVFNEPAETTKITSDVAEETDLRKCDPRSGIVAYIKNAFNN